MKFENKKLAQARPERKIGSYLRKRKARKEKKKVKGRNKQAGTKENAENERTLEKEDYKERGNEEEI